MNIIYVFSGTGNSLAAAKKIAEELENCEIRLMRKALDGSSPSLPPCDTIGFVFPCFAWGMPNMVCDFIKSGGFNKDAYFFTVVTCGSSIGGSASAIDALLREKGRQIIIRQKTAFGVKLHTDV